MNAQQHPSIVQIKMGTGFSVLYLVAGSLFSLIGVLAILTGSFSLFIILGPLFVLMGILSFVNPYCRYDSATGALFLYSPLGFKARTYGAPKNERIYFNPVTAKVMRALPNGTQRKVGMTGMNREELARLIAVLPQHQA
ncbi:MAG TPA: hypothetical protein VHG10_05600 [Glycomyces sp.]|nr:hypothetical protein [Glycomyces sp.]